jgi:hypothetical protein
MNKKDYLYKINKSLIKLKVVIKDEKVHSAKWIEIFKIKRLNITPL